MKNNKLVGVIGGLGPLATTYYMNMVVKYTEASKDQEHIDMIVINQPSTPDRTGFILGESEEDPTETIVNNARTLEKLGCDFIVMPCNTAHFIYDKIEDAITIPFINIVKETVNYIFDNHQTVNKVGLMATRGTIKAKTYERELKARNCELFIPDENRQNKIMNLIYNNVKKGVPVNMNEFNEIINYYYDNGCDFIIIGCTDLSVIIEDNNITDERIVDSTRVLVIKTIIAAGKKIKKHI